MRLPVRVRDQLTFIVGYGPGTNGKPMAIVILDGHLDAVGLEEIELIHIPRRMERKLRRARKRVKESESVE